MQENLLQEKILIKNSSTNLHRVEVGVRASTAMVVVDGGGEKRLLKRVIVVRICLVRRGGAGE